MTHDLKRAKQVEHEDLVTFINACFSCTNQREFYGDQPGQSVSIRFLHAYISVNYRELYARTLALGINHFNQGLIIVRLLSSGKLTPKAFQKEENELIRAALYQLPPQRVYKLFHKLKQLRVNNRRTRAVIRDYLQSRDSLNFHCVKYRSKIRDAVAHAHLNVVDERSRFLFQFKSVKNFDTEIFENYRKAHFSKAAIKLLPASVAVGFASKLGYDDDAFLRDMRSQLTRNERLRFDQKASSLGVELEPLELAQYPLTKIASYWLSLSREQREEYCSEFAQSFAESSARFSQFQLHGLRRVAAVLDCSYSSSGSTEKAKRPLAVALSSSVLLRRVSQQYQAFWVPVLLDNPTIQDELSLWPRGQTSLSEGLIRALEWKPEAVVIVSDGFENDPIGAVHQIVSLYQRDMDPDQKTLILHFNPVYDAENYQPKRLSPRIPTLGIRSARDIPTLLQFARVVLDNSGLGQLNQYLSARVARFLANPDLSRK